MQVGATGGGSLIQPETLVKTLPELAREPTLGRIEDGVSHSLRDLASPHISDLLGSLEHTRSAHSPQVFDGLLNAAVAAVKANDIHGALSAIAQMAKLHPEHAADLVRGEAGLAPIRGEVNQLFERLTQTARLEAVQTLAAATAVVPVFDLASVSVIATGQRFLESGTLLNYMRAVELGQSVLDLYPGTAKARSDMPLRRLRAMLRMTWQRVPLLVLLAGWFLIGVIGGIASLAGRTVGSGPLSAGPIEVWALGFLLLVGVQFFVTVRNIKMR
jgi:hypothetical protein